MESPPSYFSHSFSSPNLTPRDFETASIRSAAPSYTSEAPPYTPASSSSSPSSSSSSSPWSPNASSRNRAPSLDQFRIPTWSTTQRNPAARHYHAVAHRRATLATALSQHEVLTAAITGGDSIRNMQARMAEEEERRLKPLEDPYLVGEEAAERARQERLARENGTAVLIREDQRWDWLLSAYPSLRSFRPQPPPFRLL